VLPWQPSLATAPSQQCNHAAAAKLTVSSGPKPVLFVSTAVQAFCAALAASVGNSTFTAAELFLVDSKAVCGLHLQDNLLPWLPRGMSMLGPSFIGFFILSTGQ
jgi:hypothetical protein